MEERYHLRQSLFERECQQMMYFGTLTIGLIDCYPSGIPGNIYFTVGEIGSKVSSWGSKMKSIEAKGKMPTIQAIVIHLTWLLNLEITWVWIQRWSENKWNNVWTPMGELSLKGKPFVDGKWDLTWKLNSDLAEKWKWQLREANWKTWTLMRKYKREN